MGDHLQNRPHKHWEVIIFQEQSDIIVPILLIRPEYSTLPFTERMGGGRKIKRK